MHPLASHPRLRGTVGIGANRECKDFGVALTRDCQECWRPGPEMSRWIDPNTKRTGRTRSTSCCAGTTSRNSPMCPMPAIRMLIDRSLADPGVHSVALTTEEEGVALLAGADLGGARGVLLMQAAASATASTCCR